MADGWETATRPAMKVLGDKGKIPKIPPSVPKAMDVAEKAWAEFNKVRQDLKAKLLLLQNAASAHKNAVAQFQDMIDEDDLGLNRKDKDEAKKINDAQKILDKYLVDALDDADTNLKNYRELDKHLMNLMNYKK